MRQHWISLLVILMGLSQTSLGQPYPKPDHIIADTVPITEQSKATNVAAICNITGAQVQPLFPPGQAYEDTLTLTDFGPRVTGTTNMVNARNYLVREYEAAGYITQLQPFSYTQQTQQEATIQWGTYSIKGNALTGSASTKITAPLVAVPGVGNREDFEIVNVEDAIALVRRGDIRFSQKVENALAAGAIGVVIFNNEPASFAGMIGETTSIPVLGISGTDGERLIEQLNHQEISIQLNIQLEERLVVGHNVIAHLAGVTSPSVIVGGHADSVVGSPGANDNASGTAVVLNLARTLVDSPLAEEIWFVAFDGEEDGLQGSRAFVDTLDKPLQKNLAAMVNFDMVGVNEELWVTGSDKLLPIATDLKTVTGPFEDGGNSDHAPFLSVDIPALFFTRGLHEEYHSPQDTEVSSLLLDGVICVGLEVVTEILSSSGGD